MKPAFVLGIDGLPFTLVHKLIDEGVMPNFKQLLAGPGQLSQLHVTVPDFSCVSWTSFYTGVNPGKHGIYGFTDFDPQTGKPYTPNALDCKVAPLWHRVGEAGGRSVVLNLPNTYPAQPLRGKMISGFVAPDFERACYPPMFAQTLRALGYRMDFDGVMGLGRPANVKNLLAPVFQARKEAIRHVIRNEYWDLAICVITETDRLQHYFLNALEDPIHESHAWTKAFYVELDGFIGEVAELLDGRADLFMVSDHGFDVVREEILLEPFLAELGLAPRGVNRPWLDPETAKHSKVFVLDPGRFYINRKDGRFSHGIVTEHEVTDIIATIKQALGELRSADTNETVVSSIREKEQAFSGATLEYAPDLVAATERGYYFKSLRYDKSENIYETVWKANHVWNDAIFYSPAPVCTRTQPVIWDVMPTVLASMGIETANTEVDGRNISASEELLAKESYGLV